jgi:hypothetical protein
MAFERALSYFLSCTAWDGIWVLFLSFSFGYGLRGIWHLAPLGPYKTQKGLRPLTKSVGFCKQWVELFFPALSFSCSLAGLLLFPSGSSTRMALGFLSSLDISWIFTLLLQSNKLPRVAIITPKLYLFMKRALAFWLLSSCTNTSFGSCLLLLQDYVVVLHYL